MDPGRSLFLMLTEEPVPTRTGETVLIRQEGNGAAFISPLRFAPAGAEAMRRALEDSASAVRAASAGRESFGEFADYRGVRVLASARSIPLTGWGLVRKIDRAEALEDFHRTARLEVLLAVLFLLALGVPLAMRWRVVVARVLKEEERIFRGLLESFPDAALISSPEGRILLANTWAEKMLGYTLKELVGQPFALVIPERDREGISRQYALNNPASGQLNQRTEIVYRRKDGTEFPAEVSLSLIATSAGVVVCSSLRDITERKQAEVALVEERHLLRTLMDNLPDVIYFKDRESRFTRINQALAKAFGLSDPAQAIGKRDFDFFTGEHAQQAFADEQEIVRTGQPMLAKEEKETWPDGHVTWASSTKMPLRDARGNIVGTFGVSRDVTPRKRAEEELRHLNRALTAISAVNQAILHASEEPSLLQEVCRCVVDHAGYRMAWVGFLSDSEPRTISPVAQAGMEQGSLDSINVTYDDSERGRGPTGTAARTRRPAIVRNAATAEEYAPWRAEASAQGYASVIGLPLLFAGNLLGVLTVYSVETEAFDQQEVDFLSELAGDLAYGIQALRTRAEQARAEAALLEERHLLHTLMDNLPDVIYFKDRESRFTHINQALAKAFGLSDPAQAIGKRDFDFFTGEHAQQAFADEQEIVRTGQPMLAKEEKETWPDGHVTWASSTKMPLRDARGNIVGTFGVSRDVTPHKVLEEQLRLSQRMESVGRLAGGVAHDFNNLLTIIAGYTQLVKGGLDEGSALHGHVDEVLKASDRAASLTQQLLAFSRKQVLQVEVLDLNTALGNLEKMLLRLIGEDIELRTVPQAGLGRVKADPGQIDQVIMNLVVNARDAMPQGGTITIETANMDLTEDYTRSHFPVVPGRYVMVSVSDTGTGMSQEIQAHIFEPFFTTKEKGKGTGLGLATVYGIVKQSGGYIWVYSELGRGSTFKVYLPRVEGPLAEAEPAKVSLDSVKGSETVLVVEDEEAVRSLVRKTLESHGYKVLESQGADDALSILEQYAEPIHLLLTDVVMPQMSGQELAKRLLAMRPEVKVIYMSGYTDDAIVRHGVLEAGVSFVQKPFAPTTLAQKVRDVLKS
jgi:PAS domain S-box-containing protein